jgi:RNA polymerase sigma-70 factor (ECF subfamily)
MHSAAASPAHERQLAELLQRIAQGDQHALTALYDATSAYVYGLAVRIVHDPAAAEDVTIEVYTQIHQQASHYDPCRGTPSAWIVMLTRSRALDHWRRETLRQHREEPLERAAATPSSAPTPEEWSTERDMQRTVQSALSLLRPEQRQVIEIAYYEGLSHNAIASRLGQPLGTVKTRIRTGMMALRDLLYPLIAAEVAQPGAEPAAYARVVLPFPAGPRPDRPTATAKGTDDRSASRHKRVS